MSIYVEKILPRMLRLAMKGGPFPELRAKALASARGHVLEIGFGAGLNYPHYPAAVTALTAVEPAAVNERLFAKTRGERRLPVSFVVGVAEALPFPDASFDTVVTTWTLCTVASPEAALREVYRVLKPGGRYLFLEHGRADDPRVVRWQDRLTPLQRRIAGGCHFNRPIGELVGASPLHVESLETFYASSPRFAYYLYAGVATA